MATYGKKRRSILPSFSALRDSDPAPRTQAKKETAIKRGSVTYNTPHERTDSTESAPQPAGHDDSIEEMASMLLDDTTIEQLNPEASKRLPQIAVAKALPKLQRLGAPEDKNLPQLPRLIFNGDDVWAMKAATVVTAAGSSNKMDFSEDPLQPLARGGTSVHHSRKSSAPQIPRKSSKRRSSRPKSNLSHPQGDAYDQSKVANPARHTLKISPPQPTDTFHTQAPGTPATTDINEKIEAMMAATRALKPGSDGALYHRPLVPAKKNPGSKMLTKMKAAINDRLQARSNRKRDSIRDGRLLDKGLNELPDFEDDPTSTSALSTMELRMNEGDNFKNPKIYNLTGHGNVRRKPLAEDGKSLRSRKSIEDPFSSRPPSSGIARVPTNFEHRLKDDSALEEGSSTVPDLPELPSRVQTPKKEHPRGKKAKAISNVADFDALISSSPLAQSTPRIRLEPSFEADGKKVLKNVPSQFRSLFDQYQSDASYDLDMSIDTELPEHAGGLLDTVKRKNSENKDVGVEPRHHSKKMKKHPSPSKAELEGLERAMANFPSLNHSESFSTQDNRAPISLGQARPRMNALAPKDANKKLRDAKRRGQKPDMLTKIQVPNLPNNSNGSKTSFKTKLMKSTESGSENASGRLYTPHIGLMAEDDGTMDIDELQWDNPAYHIGMRRV